MFFIAALLTVKMDRGSSEPETCVQNSHGPPTAARAHIGSEDVSLLNSSRSSSLDEQHFHCFACFPKYLHFKHVHINLHLKLFINKK